jgi:hypothetical protein
MLLGLFLGLFFALILDFTVWDYPVWATHDIQHRYTVFGYVRDEQGKPLQNIRVIVTDMRLEEEGGTAFTDENGYYEQLLHLHNDNLGDEIVIKAGDQEKKINATFDVQNRQTERRAQADFGPTPQQVQTAQRLRYFAYGAAVVLVLGGLISLRFIGKKAGRQKEEPEKNL